MINILDKKGKPLGLDVDYEYRGKGRERYRNAAWIKSVALWVVVCGLFIWAAIISINKSFGMFLICLSISVACVILVLYSYRRHRKLLEAIGKLKK